MPDAPPKEGSAALRIYTEVRSDILVGRLEPGEKLTERKLMERFSVSRTPVREALKVLEREGLVVSQSKSGTMVTSLDPKAVAEIYKVRLALEPLAVSLAVTRLGEGDRARIDEMLSAMERAVQDGDHLAYLRCDAAIHVWIAEMSDNSLLARMIKDLTGQIVRLGVASMAQPGRATASLAEHRVLLSALLEGRGVDASHAMVVHLAMSETHAMKTTRTRSPKPAQGPAPERGGCS